MRMKKSLDFRYYCRFFVCWVILLIGKSLYSLDYYWIGEGGDWSDITHWSFTSGGLAVPGVTPIPGTTPGVDDNVYFDANSFSANNQVVNLDVAADVNDISFTNIDVTGTDMTSSADLEVSGNAEFTNLIDYTGFVNSITFTGEVGLSHTIIGNSANLLNTTFIFSHTSGSGIYALDGTALTIGSLELVQGTLDITGVDLSVELIDANPTGDSQRSIDFGGETVTVRKDNATGIALDFRSASANLTLSNSSTSKIDYVASRAMEVQAGSNAISIPSIEVSNANILEIFTNTSSTTTGTTVTFHDIIMSRTAGVSTLEIDRNGSSRGTRKVFNNITLLNETGLYLYTPNGTSVGTLNSEIQGDFYAGDNSNLRFFGDYLSVGGDVTVGTDIEARFLDKFNVDGDITIGSTATTTFIFADDLSVGGDFDVLGGSEITFRNEIDILGNVSLAANGAYTLVNSSAPNYDISGSFTVGSGSSVDFSDGGNGTWDLDGGLILGGDNDIDFTEGTFTLASLDIDGDLDLLIDGNTTVTGLVDIANSSDVEISNSGDPSVDFEGDIVVGDDAILSLGAGTIGDWTLLGSFTAGDGVSLTVDFGTDDFTFNNLTLGLNNTFVLNESQDVNVTGTFTSNSTLCSGSLELSSTVSGVQGNLNLSNSATVNSLIIQDVNVVNSNLTSNNGSDGGNNTGVTFNLVSPDLYWVGGTLSAESNSKGGAFSTGNNNNWSNPDNWSEVSGVYNPDNFCLPSSDGDVIVDDLSFDASSSNKQIVLDVDGFAKSVSMSANEDAIQMIGSDGLSLSISENVVFDAETDYSGLESGVSLLGDATGATHTIDSDGSDLSNTPFTINLTTTTDVYEVINNELITGELILESGNFTLNGATVSVDLINANPSGDAQRSIDFGGETVTVRNDNSTGIALDFRSAAGNLTLTNSPTSKIDYVAGSAMEVQAGVNAISIPSIEVSNANVLDIYTSTGSTITGTTVTFHDIIMSRTAGVSTVEIDRNGGPRGTRKVFNNITLLNETTLYLYTPNGTSVGTLNSEIQGDFYAGDNSNIRFAGDYFSVGGDVTVGTNIEARFLDRFNVDGDITIGSTATTTFIFADDLSVGGDFNVLGGSEITFRNEIDILGLSLIHI